MRLLVIVSSRIGDTLLVTPSIRALKMGFRDSYLEVRAHPGRLDVLKNNPYIDRLEAITPTRSITMGRFTRRQFDVALVFNPDDSLVRFASRVSAKVVAFEVRGAAQASEERVVRVPRPESAIHAVHERLLLAKEIGVEPQGFNLDYTVSGDEKVEARRWLDRVCGDGARHRIGVQLQSFPTKSHRDWPATNFVELLGRMAKRFNGSRFVLLGDAPGRARAQAVREQLGNCCTVAAGKLTLRESAAVMAELDLYIGVDTGPTHIAGALGIPMVALYHCLYPGRNLAPIGNPWCRAIEHPSTGGNCNDRSGMDEISVDAVWSRVEELMAKRDALK